MPNYDGEIDKPNNCKPCLQLDGNNTPGRRLEIENVITVPWLSMEGQFEHTHTNKYIYIFILYIQCSKLP